MIASGSTFYATYRDIRDALLSSKLRVSKEFLFDFLCSRGILVSQNSTREELIETIASLTHGYKDFEEIYAQISVNPRPERTTHRVLGTVLDISKLETAVQLVRASRNDYGEAINVVMTGGAVMVKVEYTELDYGKTILRQRRAREVAIDVFKLNGKVRLRYPANERLEAIVDAIVESMQKGEPGTIQQDVIDLAAFDKERRTLFFKSLIGGIDGYEFTDVTKVSVDIDIDEVAFPDLGGGDVDGEADESQYGSESDEELAESKAEAAENVKSFLKKAALAGTKVLVSDELQQFLSSGFYISRVVWLATSKGKNSQRVEIEAMLEHPAAGKGFRYLVRGFYPCKRDGSIALTRRQAPKLVKDEVLALVENAAMRAYLEHSPQLPGSANEAES